MSYPGVYFDGVSPERRAVIVSLGEGSLALSQPDGGALTVWPLTAVERADDEAADGTTRLAYGAARLRIDGTPFAAALLAAAPALAQRSPGRRALRSLAVIALAASVGLAGWWLVPRLDAPIAGLVPEQWEARIGAESIALMGGKACASEAGKGALRRLVARLTAGVALPFPIMVEVSDRNEVNAFAAPGGRIVVFQGLIAAAQSPDEVAGVLAHEITHSRKRHPTRMLIRQIGTSFLEQLVIGTDTGGMAETLLVLSYSRQFETEADEGAVELLQNAGIDTASFANFFDRLEKAQHGGALPALLTSHPAPQERSAMVRAPAAGATKPALDDRDWAALQSICRVPK